MLMARTPVQESLIGFGKRLREARRQKGLGGSELAEKLGLECSGVAHYEAGRAFPSIGVLKNLTRILGVTIDWLVFDEDEATVEVQDKELLSYFGKVDRLDPRERAAIKIYLENMLARQELDEMKLAAKKRGHAA